MEEIKFPSDFAERAERAVEQARKHGAACFWCGHGYEEYSREHEAELIAYHCPEAPEKLKEDMKRVFEQHARAFANSGHTSTNKHRCRRRRP